MFFLLVRLVLLRFECFHWISLCYIELFFNYLSTLTNNLTSGKLFGSSLLICCFPAMITTITCRPLKVPRNQSNCIHIKGNIYVIIFNEIWIPNERFILINFACDSCADTFFWRIDSFYESILGKIQHILEHKGCQNCIKKAKKGFFTSS